MVNKRAVLLMLVGSTLLFLSKVAIAHKTFDEEAEAAVKIETSSNAADAAAASELDQNIAAQKATSSEPIDPIKLA